MNQAQAKLSHTWRHIQSFLFSLIWEELGELTAKQKRLVSVLEFAKLEEHLPYAGQFPGRPPEDCIAIARAFVTKMVYDMATTRILLDRLETDPTVRRLCGWERREDVPSESTFSRAFAEFAESRSPERVHQALIEQHIGERVVGHISRDSTAITAREKPEKKAAPVEKKLKKRGRPKKGEERPKVT
ncbi:MAG: transposase [Candidatus Thiodiazotropha sp. (ex Lucinoma kastoroae)]|nr:transposase [Candidatus Thiodiazotropha sp. (ex Lucinoma kastoroae)]MCU7859227.1 transposase [Candidatus Thiodiazotropha sp. (ex Lucinoma kastoroae)]